MGKEQLYKAFEELDKTASQGGGITRIEKQHESGRMTARPGSIAGYWCNCSFRFSAPRPCPLR